MINVFIYSKKYIKYDMSTEEKEQNISSLTALKFDDVQLEKKKKEKEA